MIADGAPSTCLNFSSSSALVIDVMSDCAIVGMVVHSAESVLGIAASACSTALSSVSATEVSESTDKSPSGTKSSSSDCSPATSEDPPPKDSALGVLSPGASWAAIAAVHRCWSSAVGATNTPEAVTALLSTVTRSESITPNIRPVLLLSAIPKSAAFVLTSSRRS